MMPAQIPYVEIILGLSIPLLNHWGALWVIKTSLTKKTDQFFVYGVGLNGLRALSLVIITAIIILKAPIQIYIFVSILITIYFLLLILELLWLYKREVNPQKNNHDVDL